MEIKKALRAGQTVTREAWKNKKQYLGRPQHICGCLKRTRLSDFSVYNPESPRGDYWWGRREDVKANDWVIVSNSQR